MVERGHSDGAGIDERVAFEYAKVEFPTINSESLTAVPLHTSTEDTRSMEKKHSSFCVSTWVN